MTTYLQGLAICKFSESWSSFEKYDCNGEHSTMDNFLSKFSHILMLPQPYWFKTLYTYVTEPTLVTTLSTFSHLAIIYLIADLETTTAWRNYLECPPHVTQKAITATKTTRYILCRKPSYKDYALAFFLHNNMVSLDQIQVPSKSLPINQVSYSLYSIFHDICKQKHINHSVS